MKIASHPSEMEIRPVSQDSATSRCRLSVSPGEYRLTIAASETVDGKREESSCLISVGKGGGGVAGYSLAVQSYCPPRVIQRSFLLRS